MSLQLIPTSSDAFYTQLTDLEGTNYLLTFTYNQRERCYYLSISTESNVLLVDGIKLVTNWPLLRRFQDTRLPPGEMIAVCTTLGNDGPPDLGELGEGLRVELTYFPSTDLL